MFTMQVKRKTNISVLHNIRGALKGPKTVKVGFPAGEADSDIINRAVWNHFGTKRGIPERPFLTSAIRNNRGKYRDEMKASAKKVLLGQTSLRTVLSKLGVVAQGDIQDSIRSWVSPPNAPSTIAQKGSSQPLVDSGEMMGAATFKVDG